MTCFKAALTLLLFVVVTAGCGPSDSGSGVTTPDATVVVPATLFSDSAPAGAVSLVAAKTDAKSGDRVVFEARVGGRRSSFLEDRAVFFVADSSLPSCDELHGDTCKTPWDYCCEPRDRLTKHMATVQVVDASGQPLKQTLAATHGLAELRTVVVTGTVAQVDESGNFVVNAEKIFVKEG